MLNVTLIDVGTLKESYWRDAVAEYAKRLGGFCRLTEVTLRECKLSDEPSQVEINAALGQEAKQILAAIPPRAYTVALCVEGKQLSSEELAGMLESVCTETGELCLIIGSSFGLAPEVKAAAAYRLSVSKLTFPHQMMRVVLLEALYRALNIRKGTKYHK